MLPDVEHAIVAIGNVVNEEPLRMRPARAALKALDSSGWRPQLVRTAIGALDDLTATRRNDEGYDSTTLSYEIERAERYAYNDLEALEAIGQHELGNHAGKQYSFCELC